MIKNGDGASARARRLRSCWLLFGLSALLSACRAGAAEPRQPDLQGVIELEEVVLAFEVGGRVERVIAKEGDHLAGKVILAELDESLLRPERDARAAELEAARAELALLEAGARSEDIRAAEAELANVERQRAVLARQRTRQEQLTRSGAAPSAQLDTLDAQSSTLEGQRGVLQQRLRALRGGARKQEVEAARAHVQALEAGLIAADARLARCKLAYEGAADVLDAHVKVGEVVAAGAPAFTVADLDHPYLDVFVPQQRVSAFKVGMPLAVRVDSLRESVEGRVERIFSRTEFTPRYLFSEKERANLVLRVRVRIDDPRHLLRAGVPAFVSTQVAERAP